MTTHPRGTSDPTFGEGAAGMLSDEVSAHLFGLFGRCGKGLA